MGATSMFLGVLALLFSGGAVSGLPLGMPPGKSDPAMARVAPDDTMFYISWSGTAAASAESTNRTERLLADPEIRRFVVELKKRLQMAAHQGAGPGENAQVVATELPKLLEMLATRPTAFYVGKFLFAPPVITIDAGLVVNVGDRAAEMEKSLNAVVDVLARGQAKSVTDGGRTWREMTIERDGPKLRWGFVDGYLIAGLDDGTTDRILQRIQSDNVPAWLTTIRKRLPVGQVANTTYVNVKAIAAMAEQLAGIPMEPLQTMGLKNVNSFASITGLDETSSVSRAWLKLDGPATGLISLFAAKPLGADDLKPIPADASIAFAMRVDPAALFATALRVGDALEPGSSDRRLRELARLDKDLGFHVRDDLIKSLGDVWRVYHSPSEGGSLFTGWTGVVSLGDAKKVAEVANIIAENARKVNQTRLDSIRLGSRRPRFVGIKYYEFQDQMVYFMNFVGDESLVAPAWCVTDKELIVSSFPQGINAYLARNKSAPSLATVPAVRKSFENDERPTLLAYYDSKTIFNAVYPLTQTFVNIMCADLQRDGFDIDISLLPSQPAIAKYLKPGTTTVIPAKDGIEFVTRRTLPVGFELVQLFTPFLLDEMGDPTTILDAISPARASRNSATNHLKQIGLAMQNFHDVRASFPAAQSQDKDGKPLLSWRVTILPLLGQRALFNEFDLDEPWDSPHNKRLIPLMPDVYRVPGSKLAAGKTTYLTLRGENTIFPPGGKGTAIRDVTDGTSYTVMVVEAAEDQAIDWTKPDDLKFDAKKPSAGLFGLRNGGFLTVFADVSVHFLLETTPDETLRLIANRNDGKPVDLQNIPRTPIPGRRLRGDAVDPKPPTRLPQRAPRSLNP